ncbi:MAG: GTP-binding protein [Coleofasciculus sp. A1-SPW-01]|uniref:CobW family GTP-binding protein n=1 Tax=Coleofasciculus sp. A1-SPW-01 TaxID=3070819 RepID=UPI0032FF37A6
MTSSVKQVRPTSVTASGRGIPVTIITGFLGSGKTTLLNYILHNRQDLKIAVIVNEFGDIDIDSKLLVSIDENMVQLSNGCICCTINKNLVDTVDGLIHRDDPVDYILVETTGVADPLPIMLSFITTELQTVTHIDSILTVVDAESLTPNHYDSEAARNQLIFADIILLNKTDLVAPKRINQLKEYIRSLKPEARVLQTQYGQVSLPLILDVNLNQPSTYQRAAPAEHHLADDHQSHHLEHDQFMAVSFESDRALNLPKFQAFIDNLPTNVYRGKGILWFQGSQLRHLFQLSGKRCDMKSERSHPPRCNQLVFIGRDLDAQQIQSQLRTCLASEQVSVR